MRLKRVFIIFASLCVRYSVALALCTSASNPAWASSSERQKRQEAIEHFSLSIKRQCAIRNFFDIPPDTLLDFADIFRKSRSDKEILKFDLYAKRDRDGALISCAGEDGARCSADESIYGFYKAGEIENFTRFVCVNKNF